MRFTSWLAFYLALVMAECIGLYIYCTGFFVMRSSIEEKSQPSRPQGNIFQALADSIAALSQGRYRISKMLNQISLEGLGKHPFPLDASYDSPASSSAWLEHRYDSLVSILNDAMRYDFLLALNVTHREPYHDCISLCWMLSQHQPSQAFLSNFVADSPTTTLQRVLAITTGGLSTFMEAAKNFGRHVCTQDSLLYQINAQQDDHRERADIWFMGDDVWTTLYPDILNDSQKVWPYYSFHLFDLHSIDRAILREWFPLLWQMKRAQGDVVASDSMAKFEHLTQGLNISSLQHAAATMAAAQATEPCLAHGRSYLFSHFLGTDHCGHKYGPKSSYMSEKLQEMNAVFYVTLQLLRARTLFVAMGDHGMTEQGDHGGDSIREICAGLFMYAHGPPLTLLGVYQDMKSQDAIWHAEYKAMRSFYARIRQLKLASLNGLLRPGWTRGFVDTALLPEAHDNESRENAHALAPQMDYVVTLSLLLGLPIPYGNLGSLLPEFFYAVDPRAFSTQKDLKLVRLQNLRFLVKAIRLNALQVLRYMVHLESIGERGFEDRVTHWMEEFLRIDAQLLVLIVSEPESGLGWMPELEPEQMEDIYIDYQMLLSDISSHGRRVWSEFDMTNMKLGLWILFAVACLSLVILPFLLADVSNRRALCQTSLALIVHMVFSVFPFSSSFVIFEDTSVRFLLASLLLLFFVFGSIRHGDFKNRTRVWQFIGLFLLNRLSGLNGVCRDAQYPYCEYWSHRELPLMGLQGWSIALLGGLLLLLTMTFWRPQRDKKDSHCKKRCVERLMLFAIVYCKWLVAWRLDSSHEHDWLLEELHWHLPKLVYFYCLYHASVRRQGLESSLEWVLPLALIVQRPWTGFSTAVLFVWQSQLMSRLSSFVSESSSLALYYYLLGWQLYYHSGHQTTLTGLQWEAAYTGWQNIPQLGSALLVLLNTLAGPILAMLSFLESEVVVSMDKEPEENRRVTKQGCLVVLHFYLTCLPMLTSAMACFFLSKHLMLWTTFTPRLLFHVATSLCLQLLLLCHCIGRRSVVPVKLSER